MCGIVGWVTPPGRRPDRELVRRMADAVRHRGPDADGVWVHANVGLGHRRLTIIDTSSAADQPLFNEDRSVVVVFNGEIYNFQELRPELEAAGHRFATRSDTEVLVHGWEEWGPEMVHRLRGMFAFALYDVRAERLFIARDRIGKKPLFWTRTAGGFVFGSEIKALLTHPDVGRELDPRAVGEYTVYGNTVGDADDLPGHPRSAAGPQPDPRNRDPATTGGLERAHGASATGATGRRRSPRSTSGSGSRSSTGRSTRRCGCA